MAPSTTRIVNVVGFQDPGGTHPNLTTLLPPYNQGQHGHSDTEGASLNVVIIVIGVLVPLVLIGVGAFLVYVWYRRKYPVRMVPGRDFAKFSNPAYNKRQSTLTLVREGGDREWEDLANHDPNLQPVREDLVDGIDNKAFEKEAEENIGGDFVKVDIEDDVSKSNTVETKVEQEATRKISRDRPKTKKAVLVKSQDMDEFENAFELVSESDLGQRTDSERSSGNDSTGTHTVSVSFAETFDNRHGSLASQPEESLPIDVKATTIHEQSTDNPEHGDTSDNKDASEHSTTSDIPENVDNFESFLEVFNNEQMDDDAVDSPLDPNSTTQPDGEDVAETKEEETEKSWTEIEESFVNVEQHVTKEIDEALDINEKEKTERSEKDEGYLRPDEKSTRSLSASVESVDRTSLNESCDLSTKRPSLSLSTDRIPPNFLDIVPQTPTVLVQDSIIFESESMPPIHLVTTEAHPLRGRRAFTLNDLSMSRKISTKDCAASDQNLARHAEVRSTSSPEIHELKYGSFKTTDMLRFDFNEINKTNQVLTQTSQPPSQPGSTDSKDNDHPGAPLSDTLTDNMLLDSTFIKNEVRHAENQSGQTLNTVEELNTSLCESVHSEPNETAGLQVNPDDIQNMFVSSSSNLSENLEMSDDFTTSRQENRTGPTEDQTDTNDVGETEEIIETEQCNSESQLPPTTELKQINTHFGESLFNTREQTDDAIDKSYEDNQYFQTDQSATSTESNEYQFDLLGQSSLQNDNAGLIHDEDATPLASSLLIENLHDEFATPFLHTSTPTASGVEDTTVTVTETTEPVNKKKLAVGGFDFTTFDDDSSDSDSSTSSASSESSEDVTRESFEISIEGNVPPDKAELGTTENFDPESKHSDFNTSNPTDSFLILDGGHGMSKSADSTTLSWELVSRENSLEPHQANVNDILVLDDTSNDSIRIDESIIGDKNDTSDTHKVESSVPNVSIESSDLSWDVISGNDDNSEC